MEGDYHRLSKLSSSPFTMLRITFLTLFLAATSNAFAFMSSASSSSLRVNPLVREKSIENYARHFVRGCFHLHP